MGTPGSGRYTTYVPVKTSKIDRLFKLFKNGFKALYNDKESNAEAAQAAANRAKTLMNGTGDPDMFGTGVSLTYSAAPNTTEVEWANAGDPANPYVPDLTSPGPGKTEGIDKSESPGISPEDVKPNFDSSNPTVNTTSPSATSNRLGTLSLGQNLQFGKSSVE